MTKETEAKWVERIREWRASGLSAKDFAVTQGCKASTLCWAASQLRRATKSPALTAPGAGEVHARARAERRTPSSSEPPRFLPVRTRVAETAVAEMVVALDALARAKGLRMPLLLGLVHHSDRGSVYASGDYRAALKTLGAVASMSRKGDCWDNAVAESFFATVKGEMIDDREFQTRAEANAAIGDYIDAFYNVTRMHSTIGYVSPIEFELKLKSRREAA